jgi:uncharacterized protein (TIGR02246 family)
MNFRRKFIVLAPIALTVFVAVFAVSSRLSFGAEAFTRAQAAQSSHPNSPEIAKLRAEWVKDLHTKQLDHIAGLYAADAEFLLPNGTRVSGRTAIRDLCKSTMAMMTSDITLTTATSERSGNLAYDSGDFSETLISIPEGKRAQSTGNYLMIFRRQPNGAWLIAEQVWTGAAPDFH